MQVQAWTTSESGHPVPARLEHGAEYAWGDVCEGERRGEVGAKPQRMMCDNFGRRCCFGKMIGDTAAGQDVGICGAILLLRRFVKNCPQCLRSAFDRSIVISGGLCLELEMGKGDDRSLLSQSSLERTEELRRSRAGLIGIAAGGLASSHY